MQQNAGHLCSFFNLDSIFYKYEIYHMEATMPSHQARTIKGLI